jgi:4-amino-4-deoxy-L-arabinose transferase-like glycosyltransferase
MVEQLIIKLEKQYRRQLRFQRYGNVILALALILLTSAAGLVKLHSHKAIERIEADASIIQRQSAALERLEFTLDRQEAQLAEKDSIITAQQRLITGQASYINMLRQENRLLKEQNTHLEKQRKHEVEMDTLVSPLNQRRPTGSPTGRP